MQWYRDELLHMAVELGHRLLPAFNTSSGLPYPKATGDPYYLRVGQSIVEKLNAFARVPCGFAAVQDVRTGTHEDRCCSGQMKSTSEGNHTTVWLSYVTVFVFMYRMDSFFLAEMFKYLYLLFSEKSQLPINIDDYIFTTEAHLLPVSLSTTQASVQTNVTEDAAVAHHEDLFTHSCPSTETLFPNNPSFAKTIRDGYKYLTGVGRAFTPLPVRWDFMQETLSISAAVMSNGKLSVFPTLYREIELPLHDNGMEPWNQEFLRSMGISLTPLNDITLGEPSGPKLVAEVSQSPEEELVVLHVVQLISPPFLGRTVLTAGPAKFGMDLTKQEHGVKGHIALALRGDCMFAAKARWLQQAGASGVIFIGKDHREGSNSEETPLFQMVGDGDSTEDITLPLVFLFNREGSVLTAALEEHHNVEVLLLPKERQLGKGEDKSEKPVSMNIKLRLRDEGEPEERAARGPTLELVLENKEVLLNEEGEEELSGKQESRQQQVCTQDRTGPCSTDSLQSMNSKTGPVTNP
ncbi:hypothetical protein GOODEAATRI_004088 [Goodea atripinnis]|uniref:PA domain-containing protein n=1 Tax=Goodea atripinnis TaxID=208336 RepID=A0ABV0MPM7_9TELE